MSYSEWLALDFYRDSERVRLFEDSDGSQFAELFDCGSRVANLNVTLDILDIRDTAAWNRER